MKIGLVDVDGHAKKKKWGATIYPNLALAKIARYWRNRGGQISWASPMEHYDIVYMSKVFNFSPDDTYIYDADKIIKGEVLKKVKQMFDKILNEIEKNNLRMP